MPLEIERVFLLSKLPHLPAHEVVVIEQGYLPESPNGGAKHEGRLRRIERPDGTLRYVHTMKEGEGLIRNEVERTLSSLEFSEMWGKTEGRRLRKRRHKVPSGDLTWEVDEFLDMPRIEGRKLILAEVEVPSREAANKVILPAWLVPVVVREVTNEPGFRNYALARLTRK